MSGGNHKQEIYKSLKIRRRFPVVRILHLFRARGGFSRAAIFFFLFSREGHDVTRRDVAADCTEVTLRSRRRSAPD